MYLVNQASQIVFILCSLFNEFLCFFPSFTSCVFVSNLNKASEAPRLQPADKSLQRVLEGDLVMNVFRDGHWGAFRHQLIPYGTK